MATAAQKHEFLVVVPDKPGVKDLRLEVRPKHFEGLKPGLESGNWKMGGGLLKDLPSGDDPSGWDFYGSTFVVLAESKEEIIEIMKKDIYSTSGVWDVEKAQILPFKKAFRFE
ncbi:hypothetical protein PT974_05606 [Cladobotryum mycophilum]|uniref:YCII-related domain-containing protein n=1 Tax=Cladobotryum mycophilum TaxID=491253 RepID=A0ABR0SKD7_9HYPO